MKLNSIKLKNIRSFIDQEIEFKIGTTLLSGDIGSGKSTVLLSICFALFGMSKGYLSGNAILRNGEDEGSVKLNFSIDNKEIIIERKLKRGSTIAQLPGKIIINKKEEIKSPLELKQIILDLLNYPKTYLTKSKDLIFYYTVFTPQEEMKSILLSDKELRLEILRKIFGIDKYSLINENAINFSTVLKRKKEELKGYTQDLENKELELINLKNKGAELEKNLKPINEELKLTINEVKVLEKYVKAIEEKLKLLNKANNMFEIIKNNISNKESQIKKFSDEINNTNLKIKNIETELKSTGKIDEKFLKSQLDAEDKLLKNLMFERSNLIENIGNIKANKKVSEEIINKIKTLDNCPLCLQKVQHTHKTSILDQQFKLIEENKIVLNKLVNSLSKSTEEINKKELTIKNLNEQLSKYYLIQLRSENLKELIDKSNFIILQIKSLENEIKDLNNKSLDLIKKVIDLESLEEEFLKSRKNLEDLRLKEKRLLIKHQAMKSDLENNESFIKRLEIEINKKKEARKKMIEIIKLIGFFSDILPTLVSAMEKTIMLKLNQEFNNFFQKFFSLLINTEDINVKLDYEFTPLITQNSHDIEYINLSGGEKTAVALAYRLALNKVLNTIYSTIKTNNLIVLDEPTDGFSEEQLDKLRDVLKELNTEQIIIVSHESKIESFVENIIRLEKVGHISQVYNV